MALTPEEGAELLSEVAGLPAGERWDRFAATVPADQWEAVLIVLGDEAARLATVGVTRALEASEAVVALADQAARPVAQARARRALARARSHAGRVADVLPLCDAAYRLAIEGGDRVEAARALLASIDPLSNLSRFDEAIAAGERARDTFLAADERALAARADLNLGAVYDSRDDPSRALYHYDRARSGIIDDPVLLAQLEANRGVALTSLDDFAAAAAAFESAAAAFEAGQLAWAVALVEGNLARLATRQGKLEVALHHFERGRRFLERDQSPVHLSRMLADQAETYALLGMADLALEGYRDVLPKLEAEGLAVEAAQARAGEARVLIRLGRVAEAEAALTAAADAFDRLELPVARARVDLSRAELAAASGQRDAARLLVTDALTALEDRPAESVVARHQLARLALAEGDVAAAARELAVALPVAQSLDIAPIMAELLHTRGLLHRTQQQPDLALADFRAAVGQVERLRGTLQAERFRTAFLGNHLAIYDDFIIEALDRHDPASDAEAFETVERAKSRALLDLVGGALDLHAAAEQGAGSPEEADLLAELDRLQSELNWHYSQLDDEADRPPPTGDTGWREHVQRLEWEFDALRDRVAVARGVAGLFAAPVNAAQAHQLVPPDAALVEYFIAGGELLAFVLRGGALHVVRDLGASQPLADLARRFHFQIGRAVVAGDRVAEKRAARLLADIRRDLGVLHAMVLAPLRPLLGGIRRLIIVPHGPLHTIPFHALWDGERYVIEDLEIQYAPSVSLLAHLPPSRVPATTGGTAVVVGVADALAPQIDEEARRIAATLGAERVLMGVEATVERVTAAARTARIVHLACHGHFSVQSPLSSGLRLADRWLTVRDIYGLRLQAEVVTLSGCETGRTAVTGGDELVGLMRGLFAAGASSLLVSLWTVNDQSTADLMTTFYDAWRNGAEKPAALRAAQLRCLAGRPHPAFWAPFILGGNP